MPEDETVTTTDDQQVATATDDGKPSISEMPIEDQLAHWKAMSRKNETALKAREKEAATATAERDKLKAETQSESEKAAEAASKEAFLRGQAEAFTLIGPRLVSAELTRVLAPRGFDADRIESLLKYAAPNQFLKIDSGTAEVDQKALMEFADQVAPTSDGGTKTETKGRFKADLGQGRRTESNAKASVDDQVKSLLESLKGGTSTSPL